MRGIGASPESFVSFKASEPDHVLEQSWRVPQSVFNYINSGVLKVLEEIPNRANKPWLARAQEGSVYIETESTIKTQDGNSCQ